jgi:hypothetical protein
MKNIKDKEEGSEKLRGVRVVDADIDSLEQGRNAHLRPGNLGSNRF